MDRRRFVQAGAAGLGWPGWPRPAGAASAGRALLVGNTAYTPDDEAIAPALKCIVDLQAQLERFGFDVVALHNPDIAQVRAELDRVRQAVAADARASGLFYFVGHGFQSNAANLLVPAGGDLKVDAERLARSCIHLEKDVFSRFGRPLGPAASVILVDACRTPDKPLAPNEGYNQTLPPEGCHVVFATGPGKRAFTPQDPARHTLFTEMLVAELARTDPSRSVFLTLEQVRSKVLRRVNGIAVIVRAFGLDAQVPELASNVAGDPPWVGGAGPAGGGAPAANGGTASAPNAGAAPPEPRPAAPEADAQRELDAIAGLASPEEAAARLEALVARLPEDGDLAGVAGLRLKALQTVLSAARTARLSLDVSRLAAQPARVAEDAQRALRGDKYAALRVAESLPRPDGGDLIERTEYGRWMIFSAYLGNGIAAWRLSEHFKNQDRRDVEAARFLNLARANRYTPPRQLESGR